MSQNYLSFFGKMFVSGGPRKELGCRGAKDAIFRRRGSADHKHCDFRDSCKSCAKKLKSPQAARRLVALELRSTRIHANFGCTTQVQVSENGTSTKTNLIVTFLRNIVRFCASQDQGAESGSRRVDARSAARRRLRGLSCQISPC